MSAVEKTETLRIRATLRLKQAIDRAADEAGMTAADWSRAVLAKAASRRWLALPGSGTPAASKGSHGPMARSSLRQGKRPRIRR